MIDTRAFRLRFMATILDDIAEKQAANGLDNSRAKARAWALRVRADLIEQGVPFDIRKKPPPYVRVTTANASLDSH